ncbi:hypothetical protein TcWFU_008602 [Taenia crassiceps]|uniref:Uncharacterized protein n=1 Tax=Taenia crassiceps TaxID=6207 RepID=A0ABR4Q8J5_9CEST
MGSLKSKSIRLLPPPPLPRFGFARRGQKNDEGVSQAVEADFSELKSLVDKCVQIHSDVMEAKTPVGNDHLPVVALETRSTSEPMCRYYFPPETLIPMDDLDLLNFAHSKGGLSEELLMDILMDELTFTGNEQIVRANVEQCLSQLLVDLEEKSLEKAINRVATFPTVAKRPLQPAQAAVCAKRRRTEMEESYDI